MVKRNKSPPIPSNSLFFPQKPSLISKLTFTCAVCPWPTFAEGMLMWFSGFSVYLALSPILIWIDDNSLFICISRSLTFLSKWTCLYHFVLDNYIPQDWGFRIEELCTLPFPCFDLELPESVSVYSLFRLKPTVIGKPFVTLTRLIFVLSEGLWFSWWSPLPDHLTHLKVPLLGWIVFK